MKLGVFTVPLTGMSLDDACAWLAKKGVQMVEIGCGGNPGNAHCNAEELLAQPNIDGGLIGGASLVADNFSKLIR